MLQAKYKIYKYTFPNGKIYVGMTKNNIQERRNQGYQHNENLKRAVKEYGWERVETAILASELTQVEACKKEIEFIRNLKADDPEIGYNISKGGKATYAGLKHTQEYRQYMSRLYKGKVFSSQSISRMKAGHEKERKPVLRISLDGEVTRFESLGEAANSVNGYKSNISRACKDGKEYKNHAWQFERR